MARLLLTLAASAALLALAPAAPVPRDAEPVLYFPTKVGTKWVYDRDGEEETVMVTKVESKDGGWVVTCETLEKDQTMRSYDVVHVSRKGLVIYEQDGDVYDPPLRMLKLPYEGASWTSVSSRGATPVKFAARCVAAKGGKVRVPAGEFETVKVDGTIEGEGLGKLDTTIWLAVGVGPVKMEAKSKEDGRLLSTSGLKKFSPGKP